MNEFERYDVFVEQMVPNETNFGGPMRARREVHAAQPETTWYVELYGNGSILAVVEYTPTQKVREIFYPIRTVLSYERTKSR